MLPVVALAVLYGLFAGTVAILVTLAVERFGGIIGGTIGSTPTTIIPASLGIVSSVANDQEFSDAMFSIPLGMLLTSGFLLLWKMVPPILPERYSSKKKLAMMIPISLTAWGLSAFIMLLIVDALKNQLNIPVMWIGITALISQFILGCLDVLLKPAPAPKGANKVGIIPLLSRGILAGVAIFISVLISRTNGIAAGMASTFPAIFLTTMISVWWSQSQAVSTGAVGPLMLGSLAVPSYAISFALYQPAVGIPLGSLLSYITAVCLITIPVGFSLRQLNAYRSRETVKVNQSEGKVALLENTIDTIEQDGTQLETQLEIDGTSLDSGLNTDIEVPNHE